MRKLLFIPFFLSCVFAYSSDSDGNQTDNSESSESSNGFFFTMEAKTFWSCSLGQKPPIYTMDVASLQGVIRGFTRDNGIQQPTSSKNFQDSAFISGIGFGKGLRKRMLHHHEKAAIRRYCYLLKKFAAQPCEYEQGLIEGSNAYRASDLLAELCVRFKGFPISGEQILECIDEQQQLEKKQEKISEHHSEERKSESPTLFDVKDKASLDQSSDSDESSDNLDEEIKDSGVTWPCTLL